ncbi:M15 family metallopeptidase [Phreatobacter sp. AB_2022a]|uniref:M15 family metallopeptidase n=1 Tax=Phreatobacter sp. AB_2022a TaxID=3003134 RepID=UPI002286FFFC|nr:M15 family metallopeptidase [Phreatobacter sp. AB_2022a]MCZ0738148.1 M15 family metallopeptidase [Phreatobacter sp. AB_2022a]
MARLVAMLLALLAAGTPLQAETAGLPPGFVYLAAVDPTIRQDIRYAGSFNFLGRPAMGYRAGECILTEPAARALAAAQAELAGRGLTLVVWDCYRPARAVADFMAWSRGGADSGMAPVFHPAVDRRRLVAEGYIGARSTHARGSTVDLGLGARNAPAGRRGEGPCTAPAGQRVDEGTLDFGTAFDCFDPRSALADGRIGASARANRLLLRDVMSRHGFRGYAREWWHFQLRDEPFPTGSFDFPIVARPQR